MNKYKIEEILSNIQFQVYSDMNFIDPLELDKETWKELLEYIYKYKQVLDKIKEIVNEAPCLWYVDEEIERVDGTIDLSYEEYTGWEDILKLLEEIE